MRTERLDLRIYRNGWYHEGWQLRDNTGQPISLVGCTVEMKIRAVAGQSTAITTADIDVYDAINGCFTISVDGAVFAGVTGQSEVVRLVYDIRVIYPDNIKAIPVAGQIILTPGATY